MPEATKYRIDRAFREAKMEVVNQLDGSARTQEADFLLSTMKSRPDLSSAQAQELEKMEDFRALIAGWRDTDMNLTKLDSSQLALLMGHALLQGKASAQARALLHFYDQWDLDLPVLLPSGIPKSLLRHKPDPETYVEGILRVFPNPANDYTSVEYRIDRAFREAKIEVVDLQGRVVYSQELQRELDTVVLPLRNMEGAYILAITVDEELYQSTKLLVK